MFNKFKIAELLLRDLVVPTVSSIVTNIRKDKVSTLPPIEIHESDLISSLRDELIHQQQVISDLAAFNNELTKTLEQMKKKLSLALWIAGISLAVSLGLIIFIMIRF